MESILFFVLVGFFVIMIASVGVTEVLATSKREKEIERKKKIKEEEEKVNEYAHQEKMDWIKDLRWEWDNVFRYSGETEEWIEKEMKKIVKLEKDWKEVPVSIVERAWEWRGKKYEDSRDALNKVDKVYEDAQYLLKKEKIKESKRSEFEVLCLKDPLKAVNEVEYYKDKKKRSNPSEDKGVDYSLITLGENKVKVDLGVVSLSFKRR